MIVEIEKKHIGAEFDGVIWDYWVDLKTRDNNLLNVFDSKCLCQEIKEKSLVTVKLKALFVQKTKKMNLIKLEGVVVNKDNHHVFKTNLMEIQICEEDIKIEEIPLNTLITLFFGRIDLIEIAMCQT